MPIPVNNAMRRPRGPQVEQRLLDQQALLNEVEAQTRIQQFANMPARPGLRQQIHRSAKAFGLATALGCTAYVARAAIGLAGSGLTHSRPHSDMVQHGHEAVMLTAGISLSVGMLILANVTADNSREGGQTAPPSPEPSPPASTAQLDDEVELTTHAATRGFWRD